MNQLIKNTFLSLLCLALAASISAQSKRNIQEIFQHPPESAKPWTLWYWMHGAISKAGLTADLEAMKEIGLGGAYIVNIQDTVATIPLKPTARQLTPEWWEMIRFALQEAKRLNLKLGLHVSDGFALAGGPWITPELSMQKLVWSSIQVVGGKNVAVALPQPEAYKNYYKDVAVYAYPAPTGYGISSATVPPKVTTSLANTDAAFLATDTATKSFSSGDSCWVQYEFSQPFTCRSITIRKPGTSFQSQRLRVQVSDDGTAFRDVERLVPARHGWQDGDADNTYSIAPVTARYYRFIYGKSGTEPGSEDLDAAKWKPSLKINGIVLRSEVHLHQYEAKNASVWRIAAATLAGTVPDSLCIPRKNLINITQYLQNDGTLNWPAPVGSWVILRVGHTSTGHENATGGGGKGLECDKFNPAAIKLQFDNWFGAAFSKNPELAKEVLKTFYIDSWEAGSQNWSPLFKDEFTKRRGYDPLPWLPCMAGIPVESAAASEKFLHDIRETIAELVNDIFYKTLAKLAKEKGCNFTAESVAPTMTSDGLLHYGKVDIPMGEFWLNSPTHDKPNDMLDAVSGAHIYEKNIVQAEAFTTVRMAWNEHPGMLKTLQDRNYATGVNRLVYHVFAHNPFVDKKPGVTLDGVGLYFQRDQTWWKQGKAWVEYATRCQALLQLGKPVADIAVFTGEESPRRSVLPDHLVPVMPGIFGKDRVETERKRLANVGEPSQTIPDGVSSAANMYKAADWIDPLNGYQYDCLNPDVLKKATVKNGRIFLPGGADYGVLVLPGKRKMDPNGDTLSTAMQSVVQRLVNAGAKVIAPPSVKLKAIAKLGGKVLPVPYLNENLREAGIEKDVIITDDSGHQVKQISWIHRKGNGFDIYFIANQTSKDQSVKISFYKQGFTPEIFDAVMGESWSSETYTMQRGRIEISLWLPPNGSRFIIFQKQTALKQISLKKEYNVQRTKTLNDWQVKFDTAYGGPIQPVSYPQLQDWSQSSDSSIRYYSGTAVYTKTIQIDSKTKSAILNLGEVANIATVKVNGIDCGTVWTPPFSVDITKAIKSGENKIEIAVTNTWHNALIGDHLLPESQRKLWTTAPFRLEGKPLDKAGLIGPVRLVTK